LVVVGRLVSDLSLPVLVVACPTVREPDGLALSSRNEYLSPDERIAARALYWSLLAGKRAIEEQGVTKAAEVKAAMMDVAGRERLFRPDYAVVASPSDLTFPPAISGEVRLLIAGHIGKARLIDNVAANAMEG
jgi:pantothenate synthetase